MQNDEVIARDVKMRFALSNVSIIIVMNRRTISSKYKVPITTISQPHITVATHS